MTEQLINFETAKLAKEKGFIQNLYEIPYSYRYKFTDNTGCVLSHSLFNPSSNICTAPTQSLLQKWLREVHNIEVLISRIPPEAVLASKNNGKNILKNYNCYVWSFNNNPRIANNGSFQDIYEEALEIGLQEALKLIK